MKAYLNTVYHNVRVNFALLKGVLEQVMVNKVQRIEIFNIQKLPHKNQFKYKRKVNIESKNCEKYS